MLLPRCNTHISVITVSLIRFEPDKRTGGGASVRRGVTRGGKGGTIPRAPNHCGGVK